MDEVISGDFRGFACTLQAASKGAAAAARAAQMAAAAEEREREELLRATGQASGLDFPLRNNFSCTRCRKVCPLICPKLICLDVFNDPMDGVQSSGISSP